MGLSVCGWSMVKPGAQGSALVVRAHYNIVWTFTLLNNSADGSVNQPASESDLCCPRRNSDWLIRDCLLFQCHPSRRAWWSRGTISRFWASVDPAKPNNDGRRGIIWIRSNLGEFLCFLIVSVWDLNSKNVQDLPNETNNVNIETVAIFHAKYLAGPLMDSNMVFEWNSLACTSGES